MALDNSNDLDKLLEIAETSKSDYELAHVPTDVEKYIKYFGIKAGDEKVPARLIYMHYKQWRKQRFMQRKPFFDRLNKLFDSSRHRGIIAYHLDPEPYDLSLENRVKANTFLRKENNARKKKKESKS